MTLANTFRASPSGPAAIEKKSVTIQTGVVPATDRAESTIALAGLKTTDLVVVNPTAALPAAISIAGCRVSAADTLAVTWNNPTGDPSADEAVTLSVAVFPFR